MLIDNIKKSGYNVPTPIQKHAVPIIMAGRDIMGCAQTGSGKTAAFLLPILNDLLADKKEMQIGLPHVVIISPTRELSIQIYNEARKFAMGSFLKCCIVYGGTATRYQGDNVAVSIFCSHLTLNCININHYSFVERLSFISSNTRKIIRFR